jgi:response regulator RpfG family c-di-GMP phosphodiesterase
MPSDSTAVQAAVTDVNEIPHARQVLVLALTTLAEQRESDSESHILRVQNYVLTLANALSAQPNFAELLTPAYIDALYLSVPVAFGIGLVVWLIDGILLLFALRIVTRAALMGADKGA